MSKPITEKYFVQMEGETTGPFYLDVIDVFMLCGYYKHPIQIRSEGSAEWLNHKASLEKRDSAKGQNFQPLFPPSKPTSISTIFAWCGGALVLIFLLYGMSVSSNSNSTTQRNAFSTPAETRHYYTPTPEPTYQAPSTYRTPSTYVPPTSTYTPRPTSTPPPARDSFGTYSIPHESVQYFATKRKALETRQKNLDERIAQLKEFGNSIEYEKARTSTQATVNAVNLKVDQYNRISKQIGEEDKSLTRDIDAYNEELQRAGKPISR